MKLDGGPEWRNYRPKSSINSLSSSGFSSAVKLSQNKTTSKAIEVIKSVSKLLFLSFQIQNELVSFSIDLFKDIHGRGLVKGRNTQKVSIAVVYISCRLKNLPITLDEIARASQTPKKEISRLQKTFSKLLNLQLPQQNLLDFLYRFSSELKLNRGTTEKSEDILRLVKKHSFDDGLSPNTVIGIIIYYASKLEKDTRSQATVAKVVGVSELTIRNGFHRLNKIISL